MTRTWRVLVILAILVGPLAVALGAAAPANATTYYIEPGDSAATIEAKLEALAPGDTLLVKAGTYGLGDMRVEATPGTAAEPIMVKAADPNNRPLFVGGFWINGPTYWTIQQMRFKAADTVLGLVPVQLRGGSHWWFKLNEVYGSNVNDALTNLNVAQGPSGLPPTDFSVVENCIHHAGDIAGSDLRYHNIYVNAGGDTEDGNTAGSVISRNILYAAPDGAGVKVGRGSAGIDEGDSASNLYVRYNTVVNSARGIIIGGEMYGNLIRYNLVKDMSYEGGRIAASTIPLLAGQDPNKYATNYFYDVLNRNAGAIWIQHDLALDNTYTQFQNLLASNNPNFDSSGCDGFRPAQSTAKQYGRYSTTNGSGY